MVHIIEAKGLHKAELIGKADPLVFVCTQHVHKQSTVHPLSPGCSPTHDPVRVMESQHVAAVRLSSDLRSLLCQHNCCSPDVRQQATDVAGPTPALLAAAAQWMHCSFCKQC